LICSLLSNTGKTLVARLCSEFNRTGAPPAAPFDLGTEDSGLAEFLPDLTIRASIANIQGQMALFDHLAAADGIPKVVDIGCPYTIPFFTIMRDIEFAAEARRRAISTSVLFIASLDEASINMFAGLKEQFPTFTLVPVYNEIVAYGRDVRRTFTHSGVGLPALQISRLPPRLQTTISKPPFSFSEFRRDMPPEAMTDFGLELELWLRRIFRQLRELELSILIKDLRPVFSPGTGRTGD
jgi:hypothetical protein